MSMIGPGRVGAHRGQATLTAPVTLTPAVADTYEVVSGVWSNGSCHAFETSAAGVITYSGESGAVFLLNGTSDLGVAIADTTTYALFINGALVPDAETPHTFTSPAKTENIAITALVELNSGDLLQVYAKSLAGNAVNIATLRITLWGGV